MHRLFEIKKEPKPEITDRELVKKCQENPWLKHWGVMFVEDPFALQGQRGFEEMSVKQQCHTVGLHP